MLMPLFVPLMRPLLHPPDMPFCLPAPIICNSRHRQAGRRRAPAPCRRDSNACVKLGLSPYRGILGEK
eukprot:9030858-Pyramimonas_sp.AAC.1